MQSYLTLSIYPKSSRYCLFYGCVNISLLWKDRLHLHMLKVPASMCWRAGLSKLTVRRPQLQLMDASQSSWGLPGTTSSHGGFCPHSAAEMNLHINFIEMEAGHYMSNTTLELAPIRPCSQDPLRQLDHSGIHQLAGIEVPTRSLIFALSPAPCQNLRITLRAIPEVIPYQRLDVIPSLSGTHFQSLLRTSRMFASKSIK